MFEKIEGFDPEKIRRDFPALHQEIHGKPLAYLDNAASTQKPEVVIETIAEFYRRDFSNVHRGVHTLSQRATKHYEGAREKVRQFINARERGEIIFVRGTTEGINLVAQTFVRSRLQPGDEIIVTGMEHHSNIVPWQLLQREFDIKLKVVPLREDGTISVEKFAELLGPKTKFVSVIHVSNALGTINPVEEIISLAKERGVPVLLDGAQAAPHMAIDVQKLDCDFYAFSGHKLFGPTGIGVLYGKIEHLREMPPYHGGGDMIRTVTFEKSTFAPPPAKFEAGTPHIAGAIGLAAAIDYLNSIGMDKIARYEEQLLKYATEKLSQIPRVKIIGTAPKKTAVISFIIEGVHPHDIGTILDAEGIAIRAGHHCAQPVMDYFKVPATARASFAFYNLPREVDNLVEAIHKTIELLG